MTRILTGDRPTGALHLGHYFGTLANRVRLQREGYELFVVVADYQVITDRDHPGDLSATITELVRDYLAVGMHVRRRGHPRGVPRAGAGRRPVDRRVRGGPTAL